MKTIQTLVLLSATAVLAACTGEQASKPQAGGAQAGCTTRAYDSIGGPIELISHTGDAVTEADFKGSPTLIYFGFTYCPDICPSTLVTVKNAYERLPDDITAPQTLLITIDPERDTPEAMARYVGNAAFPEGLVGLTGSEEQIRAAANGFIADYSRIETPESLSEYTMDHTSLLYLMDEDWSLKTFFSESNADPQSMAECLAYHIG
ncbi:MAG: SCO family protein [Henriciella sp.]